jgi:hypothetical protein
MHFYRHAAFPEVLKEMLEDIVKEQTDNPQKKDE